VAVEQVEGANQLYLHNKSARLAAAMCAALMAPLPEPQIAVQRQIYRPCVDPGSDCRPPGSGTASPRLFIEKPIERCRELGGGWRMVVDGAAD
jgi:hypothetical protein